LIGNLVIVGIADKMPFNLLASWRRYSALYGIWRRSFTGHTTVGSALCHITA